MAKVISDEILKLKIVVNGDEAQKRVLDLEKANNVLSIRLKDLNERQKQLSKQRKKDSEEYKKNEQEIKRLSAAFDSNRQKIDDEIKGMNIMNLTMEQLTRRANDLRFAMNHMAAGSGLDNAREEYQRITDRLRELRTGANNSSWSIQNLSDKFNQYSGIAVAVAASLAGFAVSIQNTIDMNNKMADAQTAVAKTTGMTKQKVNDLAAAYSDFDTRTSKIDLLRISTVGGRLGVPKEEILDFTRVVDQAYVALGDSFEGGVEKVAEKIGKIKGLFDGTKELTYADAINKIGSALNELGADGAASEGNIADFTLRVGQLPANLKPTVAETMALGAAFEESGVDAERASSGYSKFVRTAAKDTAAFAQVMHISQQEVESLINKDPLQFFLKFSEGAKGLDATVLASILDGLKLNDNEVISIIGAASENTDRFRKSIELSNQALSDATSLQNEFNQVNNNAAGIYEKVRKKFVAMFTSDSVAKSLNWTIQTMGKMLGVVEDAEGGVTGFRDSLLFLVKILTVAVVAIFSYNTALALSELTLTKVKERLLAYTVVQKVSELLNKTSAVAQNIWNASIGYGALAIGKLTGSTNLQTIAQERLNLVTKANPWGAVLAVVMAVVTAYMLFRKSSEELREAEKKRFEENNRYQSQQNEILQKGKSAVEDYKNSVANLVAILRDENASQEIRKKSYQALIKMHPEFMGTVDKEYMATKKLSVVYKELAAQIDLSARIRARAAAKQSVYDENAKLELEYAKGAAAREKEQQDRNKLREPYSYSKERADSAVNMFGSFEEHNKGVTILNQINANNKLLRQYNEADKVRIAELQKALSSAKGSKKKQLEMELYSLLGAPEESTAPEFKSNYTPLPEKEKKHKLTDEEKAAKKAENEYQNMRKRILEHKEDYDKKEVDLEAEKQLAISENQKEGYEKERAMIIAENGKKQAELEKMKFSSGDFADLDKIIAREKGALKVQFEKIKEQWIKENAIVDDIKEQEKEKTNTKLLALDDKYLALDYKKQEEALQKRVNLITREQNQTIATAQSVEQQKAFLASKGYSEDSLWKIKTWEEGKAQIEKYYQQKALEQQISFLQEQLDIFDMMADYAPDFITADQIETIQSYKDKIAALLAEVTKLKKGEEQKLGGALSSFGGGNTDIFGLTPDQWKAMFTNTDNLTEKIQKVGAAVSVMQNMFAAYSSFVQANEQKMLTQMEVASDRKKKRLKSQLDSGVISQEEYKKQSILIDSELDNKKAEIEYQAAKRQRDLQIAQAITGVAMSVINAANTTPFFPVGMAMMAVAAALGAVQIGTIMSTPLPSAPGAEDGFYPVIREQDNKLFNARRKKSKTGIYNEPTMLVGEAGASMPELVVSGKTLRRIDPKVNKMYMNEIQRVEGFENGLMPSGSNSSGSDELLISAMAIIAECTTVMRDLRDKGVTGRFVKNAKNGKAISESQEMYKNLRNNSKN